MPSECHRMPFGQAAEAPGSGSARTCLPCQTVPETKTPRRRHAQTSERVPWVSCKAVAQRDLAVSQGQPCKGDQKGCTMHGRFSKASVFYGAGKQSGRPDANMGAKPTRNVLLRRTANASLSPTGLFRQATSFLRQKSSCRRTMSPSAVT